jgi:hypothetical protein
MTDLYTFKRNAPGCNCCLGDMSFGTGTTDATGRSSNLSVYEPVGNGSTTPLYAGTAVSAFNVSSVSELGAGAVVCGVDTENHKWLCQKTNGEVWSIEPTGVNPELVWPVGSDAAGETVRGARWHPSWGFGSAFTGDHCSFDANGDFVQGPYNAGFFHDGHDISTESAGDLYHVSGVAAPWQLKQNNANYGSTQSDALTRKIFNDTISPIVAASVGGVGGLYRIPASGGPTLVITLSALFGSATGAVRYLYWNNAKKRLDIGMHLTFDHYQFRRVSLDGATNILLWKAHNPGDAQVGYNLLMK